MIPFFGGEYLRWEQALAALLRALSVPEMPMQVQLERSIEAAVLCEGMGLKVNRFSPTLGCSLAARFAWRELSGAC